MTDQMALRYCLKNISVKIFQKVNETHINFDVEVLEVECMLPDVNTNDGDMGQERILVRRGDNLQSLAGGVQSLHV